MATLVSQCVHTCRLDDSDFSSFVRERSVHCGVQIPWKAGKVIFSMKLNNLKHAENCKDNGLSSI